ncbi:MAG TPA: pyruvate carboxylase subunit B [Candidatus Syntrophosphaera sp.]|mgnify:FL=1|uniref:Pyruvate carboxylase subunit B n=1 Tax=Candidatus Syntrophosphaera thermopropionivorans TaxID=2593015 RepID=A0AC61QL79_9BACT|nr:pyruvate carboxylase subunit B [Candidatus Syntrophosphaera thermopropionivorans]TDF74709.1 pyruvate carboxylase subunit B [Candidatus Syntrophosphaera thermopropionivorans]HOJ42094.1 pyruvate carboxylase subunit B [Candidatus Syntrophosphaera thermopropionivorans]HOT40032.1 pyruvate carboxylase subunit B [Candidatus Syntrophosphaera thermopropionivorans]HRQ99152.1 pyruvate carboxylase subunit B [Candidatus Syntrophosphaera sp.]
MQKHGILEYSEMRYEPDRPKAANPIKIQDLTFRDGHQSLFATRVRTEDLLHVAELMDQVGFYSMEVWGGATFDVMHRYLGEDPWERIRVLKKHITKTPFSMLLRGQNLVGYRNYPDDIVETFVQRCCDNGIDIFRVFDALNDFRNFQTAVKIIKKNNKHFQGAICFSLTEQRMGGEIYNIEYYVSKAKQLEDMGADTICIKDMAGLIAPYDAYDLIRALKENVKVPVHLHTHFTSGMGDLSLFKAIEAGVDIIDTCVGPYAYRTSHPAIEPLVISLLGTNRDTGFDIKLLNKIGKEMEKDIPKYMQFADTTKFSIIDTDVIIHQTPGGMISNLINQLRQMDALDRLDDVFKEIPRVRKDLGQIPLVTPTSQIVGIQAVNNTLFDSYEGEYSHITEEVKDLCYGLYGKTPMPINPEVQKKALKGYPRGEKPITVRPGDILEPGLEKAKQEAEGLAKDIDDVLIVALYNVTGKKFLRIKYGLEPMPDEMKPITLEEVKRQQELCEKAKAGLLVEPPVKKQVPKPEGLRQFDVFVDDEYFLVEVSEKGVPHIVHSAKVASNPQVQPSQTSNPQSSPQPVKNNPQPVPNQSSVQTASTAVEGTPVTAPMPGMLVRYEKKVGDKVKVGETLLVLEAMKMYNNIPSPVEGTVVSTPLNAGDSVGKGDVMIVVKPD